MIGKIIRDLFPLAHDALGIAVIRVLDHHHGGQGEVILVVRVEEPGRFGRRQEQRGLLVPDIEGRVVFPPG
ncbi:MAG: hypothetical protein ABSG91_13210 [Syntrophobacteraceae bacterium]